MTKLSFAWDFGNGKQSMLFPTNNSIQHTYPLVPGEEGTFLPKVTITNEAAGENSCATIIDLKVSLKLVINKNTKIRIYFDSSGSMGTTETPLGVMRSTLLKNRLLPLYGNDAEAYNRNVEVINFGDERTLKTLNLNGDTPEGNVIVLVFQDEAHSVYQDNSSITTRKSGFNTDIVAFRKRLQSNFGTSNPNYYRGVVFQVDGNNSFKDLMKAVEKGGHKSYPAGYNLADRREVSFVYDIQDGGTPVYYLDQIVAALRDLGFDQLK